MMLNPTHPPHRRYIFTHSLQVIIDWLIYSFYHVENNESRTLLFMNVALRFLRICSGSRSCVCWIASNSLLKCSCICRFGVIAEIMILDTTPFSHLRMGHVGQVGFLMKWKVLNLQHIFIIFHTFWSWLDILIAIILYMENTKEGHVEEPCWCNPWFSL